MTRSPLAALLLGAALTVLATTPALAQAARASATTYKSPRLKDGRPDLQGVWTNATLTPFERPREMGSRRALTPQEAEAIEGANARQIEAGLKPTDPSARVQDLPKDCGRGFTGTNCGYNGFWTDPGTRVITLGGEKRASMLLEPADGRLPALTEAGRKRQAERAERMAGGRSFESYETRSLGERCIMSFGSSAGPPMIPLLYNNTYQIVQSGDEVAIHVEMIHDVRIVRMTDKHLPSSVRTFMGDSIGRWDGDTLVVETTNFRPDQTFRSASANMKVIERFTRVGPDQILYRFTVEDPETFTAPFGGEVAMNATPGPIYEYACHEGNYGLPGILAGAREDERNGRVPSSNPDAS